MINVYPLQSLQSLSLIYVLNFSGSKKSIDKALVTLLFTILCFARLQNVPILDAQRANQVKDCAKLSNNFYFKDIFIDYLHFGS